MQADARLAALDYAIVVLYLASMIALGAWVARRVKGFASFFVAGRMLTTPLLVCTLVSTYYGLDVTFGVSELSFAEGVVAWFAYSRPYYVAILIAAWLLVPRLKSLPFLSLADVVGHFYGRSARVTVALAAFLYNLPVLSIMGMGVLFHASLGLSELEGAVLGAVIATVYTLLGGLWADALTDTVQFAIMCVTLAIALPAALREVGGFAWIAANLEPRYLAPMGELPAAFLLALVFSALSVFVEPSFYQRIFSARDRRAVRGALVIGVVLWAAYDWAVTVLGIAAAAAVRQGWLSAGLAGREALLEIALVSLPVGLKGFFIAGVLSAAMSTVDSYLLLASGNLVYDIYRPLFEPAMSEPRMLQWTRFGIVAALAPCLAIALYFRRITDAWLFMSTVLTATAVVPIFAALFLPGRRSPPEGIASSLLGLAAVILYYAAIGLWGRAEAESYVLSIPFASRSWDLWREYALLFALPVSALGFVCGSALARRKRRKA